MSTLEELKNKWEKKGKGKSGHASYDENSFERVVKTRVKKYITVSMKYFWASFALQLMVYAILSHVIVRHWNDKLIVMASACGILLYVPFMIVLMTKFKEMAVTKMKSQAGSIQSFVQTQHDLLESFYRFKRRYELFLIPLVSALGVWLVFRLWVPGGAGHHFEGVVITFVITVISCVVAINRENRKNFEEPLSELRRLLDEFKIDE